MFVYTYERLLIWLMARLIMSNTQIKKLPHTNLKYSDSMLARKP